MTTIIGIDCATEAKKIGMALATCDDGVITLKKAHAGAGTLDNVAENVAKWIDDAKAGQVLLAIDAPMGWPNALTEALPGHKAGECLRHEANQLFFRETDRFVKEKIGKTPLAVGADRIARTAHAGLCLLEKIRKQRETPIPLVIGDGNHGNIFAIEVYPAATLCRHEFTCDGYKADDDEAERRKIWGEICKCKYFDMPVDATITKAIVEDADVLDAVVCVLAGADFLSGKVYVPKDGKVAPKTVEREGWIWVYKPDVQSSQT